DVSNEGTFVWVSGEPATFFNWESRAPEDCCTSTPHEEDYVHIENGSCWPQPGTWNDLSDHPEGHVENCAGSVPVNGVVELPSTSCTASGIPLNGDFECGDLSGWTVDGVDNGVAQVIQEGTCWSFWNTQGIQLAGDFAAIVRSGPPSAATSSVGILTSA